MILLFVLAISQYRKMEACLMESYQALVQVLPGYQEKMRHWHQRNFPVDRPGKSDRIVLKLAEEVGELCRAQVNGFDEIKGDRAHWHLCAEDAVGDVLLALLVYCNEQGVGVSQCLTPNWSEVSADHCVLRLVARVGQLSTAQVNSFALTPVNCADWNQRTQAIVSDIILSLLMYCHQTGHDINHCLALAWNEIKDRDFTKTPAPSA